MDSGRATDRKGQEAPHTRRIPEAQNALVCGVLIGLCFLWTGSAYLTWVHLLGNRFPTSTVYLFSESFGGYAPQVLGLLLYGVLVARNPARAQGKWVVVSILLVDLVSIGVVALSDSGAALVAGGVVMNLMHGMVAGTYLVRLASTVPASKRGIAFGGGYAFGSVGSWLLSLLDGGDFLAEASVFGVYVVLALLTVLIVLAVGDESQGGDANSRLLDDAKVDAIGSGAPDSAKQSGENGVADTVVMLKASLLPGAVVVLAGFANQAVFCAPALTYLTGQVSNELVRAFYAVGLLCAAAISDRNRGLGLIMVLVSFAFSIIALPLGDVSGAGAALAALGYVLMAFFVVYRAVAFADLAVSHGGFLPLAVAGLAYGRAGEASGAWAGWVLRENEVMLVALASIAFALLVIGVFALYRRDYLPVDEGTSGGTREERIVSFRTECGFSRREQEVFDLMLAGKTNGEIAAELYISQNTVKIHVRNVLKKAGCKNRVELAALTKTL